MPLRRRNGPHAALLLLCAAAAPGAEPLTAFPADVQGILREHCLDCHGPEQAKAKLDFTRFAGPAELRAGHELWRELLAQVGAGEMPPVKRPAMPAPARERLLAWTRELIARQAADSAGDPGPVPLRRLTRGEYEKTVQVITGQPIQIAFQLPSDLVGAEGFGNAAAMQLLTDGHLERYLRAAETVAGHARVLPTRGLVFESTPASPDNGEQIRSHLERAMKVYGSAVRRGRDKDAADPFDLGTALWITWQAARGGDLAALCAQAKAHAGHVREIGEQLAKPSASPWVKQLLLEPWQALLADRGVSREAAEQACRRIAGGIKKALTSSFDLGAAVPIADAHRQRSVLGGHGGGTVDEKRLRDVIVRRGGQSVLPLHLVLTDGGTGVDGSARVVGPKPWIEALAAALGAKAEAEGRGMAVTLPVPGAYAFDIPLSADEVAEAERFAQGAKDLSYKGSKLERLLKEPMAVHPVAGDPRFGMQILVDFRPVLDALGRPLTAAPRPGQVLPGQSWAVLRGGHFGGLFFPTSGAAAADAFAAFDELMERFAPMMAGTLGGGAQPQFFGGPYRSRAERFGHGPEVLYARVGYYEAWLRRHVLSAAQSAQLEEAWLDVYAATSEPWRRLEGLRAAYPAIAELPAEQCAAKLATLPPLPIETHMFWARRPAPPAARWREAMAMIAAIEARQEEHALADVLAVAPKAWRRPLTSGERGQLEACYRSARGRGLSAEESARTVIEAILVSPHFLFRVEPAPPGAAPQAVDDHALAVRLSYLLWAAPPDELLRQAADAGKLDADAGIREQVARMRRDRTRIGAFVQEFFGQWLKFRNYWAEMQVDSERYPAFTPEVKRMLLDQLETQFLDLVMEDRPVTDLIDGTQTFISPYLARYYGIPLDRIGWPTGKDGTVRLPGSDAELHDAKSKKPQFTGLVRADLSKTDRRGFWGLGAMLALSSKPLRTDPIHRANLVHTHLLGRRMPPPPDDAGMLPEDDKLGDGKSVRQRLEAHRVRADCASCHGKFDDFGFALERYDAIGRWRERDAEGVAIDDRLISLGAGRAVAAGETYAGPLGLARYLTEHRDEFLRTFCRKLIAYALGRDPLPGDEPLIAEMLKAGAAKQHRFTAMVEPLLLSRQFRQRHGKDAALALASP